MVYWGSFVISPSVKNTVGTKAYLGHSAAIYLNRIIKNVIYRYFLCKHYKHCVCHGANLVTGMCQF